MFVEGGYNRRLEVIVNSGSPAGKTRWICDQTEMAEAKKRIESCAPGGGSFLSRGAVLDQAKGENIHTDLRNARECGAYETHNDSMGESLQRIDAKTRPVAFLLWVRSNREQLFFAANGTNVRETSKSLCEFAAAFGVFRV